MNTYYRKNENDFVINSEENNIDISLELNFSDIETTKFNPDEFQVIILNGNDFIENDIFQLKHKPKAESMGWLIPFQALLSNEHDFASFRPFLTAAYLTVFNLINNKYDNTFTEKNFTYKAIEELSDNINLDDLFAIESDVTDYLILIFKKSALVDINQEDYRYFFFSLYLYGLFNNNKLNKISDYRNNSNPKNQKLKLKSLDISIQDDFLIDNFLDLINLKSHAITKFHLLYQVIEFLMEIVFDQELNEFIESLKTDEVNKTSYQVKKRLQELATESDRIKKIFNNYCKKNEWEDAALNTEYIQILHNLDEDSIENIEDEKELYTNMYSIRNKIFHNFRSVYKNIDLIKQSNDRFVNLVFNLLVSFEGKSIPQTVEKELIKSKRCLSDKFKDMFSFVYPKKES